MPSYRPCGPDCKCCAEQARKREVYEANRRAYHATLGRVGWK